VWATKAQRNRNDIPRVVLLATLVAAGLRISELCLLDGEEGEGGVQTLEQAIGCTIAEALTLLSGRGVVAPNWHPGEKMASQLGGQSELEGTETA
jgi:hypothetical protein